MKFNKHYCLSALFAGLTFGVSQATAAPATVEPGIPSNSSSFYYAIGGGAALPNPPSFSEATRSTHDVEFNLGYSCGNFDAITDVGSMIEDLLNGIEDAARKIPQQLLFALEAAVTAMPGYLLNKANPALYNVLMKSYEDSFELYEIAFKNCQQMQRDIANGDNPYQNFIQATIADRWRIGAGINTDPDNPEPLTIDQLDHEILTGDFAAPGLTLYSGQQYGGAPPQEPIRPNYLAAIVGYNVLLGNAEVDNPAGSGETTEPVEGVAVEVLLPTFWPTAGAAAEWIVDVIGDTEYRLQQESQSAASGGRGLRALALMESYDIYEALDLAVNQNDFDAIRGYGNTLQVSGNLVHAIRNSNIFDREVMMQRLSTELAADLAQNKAIMAKMILRAGLKEAGLVTSTGQAALTDHVLMNSIPAIDSSVRDLQDDISLRNTTYARTVTQILRQSELNQITGSGARAPATISRTPLIDGAVVQ